VTDVRSEFGGGAGSELRRRSALIRARVPEHAQHFLPGPAELNSSSALARSYGDAIAYFKKYSLDELPDESVLLHDLNLLISLYILLVNRASLHSLDSLMLSSQEGSDDEELRIVERRRYSRHLSIERNARTSKLVKRRLGTSCQGCGFNFRVTYGDWGEGYIEAHHLTPLHSLPENRLVSMDPAKDFAVLCSNCHRMVHRNRRTLSLEELRVLVQSNKASSES